MVLVARFPKLQTLAFSNRLLSLCHEARNSDCKDVYFDLSKTEFITPFGIILLTGTIAECLAQQKSTKYLRPGKPATNKFMSGIGFYKFFKIREEEHKIESRHVQLKRIYEVDYLLTDQILDVFRASIRMSDGVIGSLKMALNELMTNAFDHSDSRRGCYVCAQTYNRRRTIRLCIADFGIGILESLRKVDSFKSLKTDDDAIMLSVQQGVTSRTGKDAGYGLSHINRFIEVNEGTMHILSGNGKVAWNYSGIKKRRKEKQTMHHPFEGTIINLTINADGEGYYFMQSGDGAIF